jgi:hypothetical protein
LDPTGEGDRALVVFERGETREFMGVLVRVQVRETALEWKG